MELFDRHIRPLPAATIEVLEGADHSFRGKDWPEAVLLGRLVSVTGRWIDDVSSGRSPGSGP